MALTEVNSKSIKDGEIVNADVNASAAIAGSKLADDSITEGKLDIHQAPSDGKFLKYTSSNGMEWGDVPAGVGGATGVTFNDNVVASWGTGTDLQISHDGSNSYIKDTGTGALFVRADGAFAVQKTTSGENMIYATADGSVDLYHNDAKKFETSATGVTVTGTVAATAVTGDGSGLTGIDAGATGGGTDKIFWENGTTIDNDYTVGTTFGAACNAMSAGPITINSGKTVTVDAGDTWTIV